MKYEFKKASRKKSKLRLLLSGLSGSGKTYSSLLIASGIGKKIAVIDTERGSASLYSDLVDFDVLELPDFKVDTYISAINQASKLGYDVIIVDSITHAWDQIKEQAENNAKGSNSWSGWAVASPMHKKFVDALVSCQAHIIACVRAKTEWVLEEYENRGFKKQRPVKIGLAPEQKGNIEYEFTLAMTLDSNNTATFIKDRTSKFLGKTIEKPGVELGSDLLNWLNEGEEIPLISEEQIKRFNELTELLKIEQSKINAGLEMKGFSSIDQMTQEVAKSWIGSLEERLLNLQAKSTSERVVLESHI